MGLFLMAENNLGINMEYPMPGTRTGPLTHQMVAAAAAASSSSAPRVERKTMEKNRRNRMKYLYSMLNSIIPKNNQDPKEAKSLPDQIDDAAKYIKYLQARVNEAKEKRDRLKGRKRLHNFGKDNFNCSTSATLKTIKSTKIDVRVHRSALEVTLVSGLSDQFVFLDVVKVLHEERAEVLSANSSIVGSSVYHLIHARIGEGTEAAAITEKLRKLVDGSSSNDTLTHQSHQQHHLWDFEISPNIWEFDMFHAWHTT